jgi:hypothetical protein
MSQYKNMEMKGDNSGCGNRAVAESIRGVHHGHSSDWTSSRIKPSRSIVHAPGAASSVLKAPRRSHSKSSGLMD